MLNHPRTYMYVMCIDPQVEEGMYIVTLILSCTPTVWDSYEVYKPWTVNSVFGLQLVTRVQAGSVSLSPRFPQALSHAIIRLA